MTRRRAVSAAVVGVVAAAFLAACSSSDGSSDESTSEMSVAIGSPPTTLNPALGQRGWTSNAAIQPAYEPLIRMTNEGELTPGLATAWKYTDATNTTFEMTIRTDATFADGEPVTAQAVADSINYFMATPGPNSTVASAIETVAADGEKVVVTTSEAHPALPTVFTQAYLWGDVISPAGLKDPESLATSPAGAGPYVLDTEATLAGTRYVYVANKKYWDADRIGPGKLTIKVVKDPTAVLSALRTGEIDFAAGDYRAADSARDANLHVSTMRGYLAGLFIVDRSGATAEALGDVRVRQAMNYAVDRESITRAAFGTYGSPVAALTAPGADTYSEELAEAYTYDPDRARQLLAEAGYGSGLTVKLDGCGIGLNNCTVVQQAIVEQLKAVGITVDVENGPDIASYVKMALSKNYGLVYMSYSVDHMYFMHHNLTSSSETPYNPFGVVNEEADALISQASRSQDEADQRAKYAAAQKIYTEAAWFLPVANHDLIFLSRADLSGVPQEYGLDVSAPNVTEFGG